MVWENCQRKGGVVVNWGGHFRAFQKKCGSGNVPGGARRCAPGKTGAKENLFYRSGKHFSDKGVFKSLEGKGVCPEVPGGLRNEAATWKLDPPKPPNTPKKKTIKTTLGHFWFASVNEKPPQGDKRRILPLKGPNQAASSTNLCQAESTICLQRLWLKFFQDTLPYHLQVSNVHKPWPSQSCRRLASPLAQAFVSYPALELGTSQKVPERTY